MTLILILTLRELVPVKFRQPLVTGFVDVVECSPLYGTWNVLPRLCFPCLHLKYHAVSRLTGNDGLQHTLGISHLAPGRMQGRHIPQ